MGYPFIDENCIYISSIAAIKYLWTHYPEINNLYVIGEKPFIDLLRE